MEQGPSQEETSREQKTGDLAPLDDVDYKRLARLTAQISSPTDTAGASRAQVTFAGPKKSALPLILGVAALALLIFAGLGIYWLTSSKQSAGTNPLDDNTPPVNTNQQGSPPRASIKHEMIAIPGGTFQMGRSGGPPQESPPHAVTVGAFSMDNTEVTNAEYADFVRETGYPAPSHFINGKPVAGQEYWPVVNVSVEDAQAFAAWRSKRDNVTYRLPTEEEWEYAARNGEQNSLYPWGNSTDSVRAAVKNANIPSLQPVGSYPDGKNKWGVVDLIGNVWEWTSSKASIYQGGKLQLNPEHKDWNLIRGGSIFSELNGDKPISSAYRDWIKPTVKNPALGFRLVRSTGK